MNRKQQEAPIYENHYMGFWIKVYPSRVDFKASGHIGGGESVPLNQIASIHVSRMGIMTITLETTGGKRYTIPTMKKQEVRQAILGAQARLTSPGYPQAYPPQAYAPQISVADEITKLHQLMQQGIISQAEFEHRKRQLLGF